jgi:uncharacterized protein (TIGR02270 family)
MILQDIVERHLDEACFLWEKRQDALTSRRLQTLDLRRTERRLLAHLDGLVVAGAEGWPLLRPMLDQARESRVAVAAWVAFEAGVAEPLDELLVRLPIAEPPLRLGTQAALRITPSTAWEAQVRPWLDAAHWRLRTLALDVLSYRRAALLPGQVLEHLSDPAAELRAAAALAIGRLRLAELRDPLAELFQDDEPGVRAAALWGGFLVGATGALAACRAWCDELIHTMPVAAARTVVALLGLTGQPQDVDRLLGAQTRPELRRSVVIALGNLGSPAAMRALLALSGDPALARLVGTAIAQCCGVDLQKAQLVSLPTLAAPEGDFEGYLEDGLPLPDASKLAAWWQAEAARFDDQFRYCNGAPHSRQSLEHRARTGSLGQQQDAAYELALLDPQAAYPETTTLVAGLQ